MSKTFAANLRVYRALAHMTQTDLAKGVVRVTAARVQIPASPLKARRINACGL